MTIVRIPITPGVPNFRQRVVLDGTEYTLDFRWSQREAKWYLDLRDSAGAILIAAIKLVVNWPLLYRHHTVEGVPAGELLCADSRATPADPGLEDLGDVVQLVYGSADDVAGAAA